MTNPKTPQTGKSRRFHGGISGVTRHPFQPFPYAGEGTESLRGPVPVMFPLTALRTKRCMRHEKQVNSIFPYFDTNALMRPLHFRTSPPESSCIPQDQPDEFWKEIPFDDICRMISTRQHRHPEGTARNAVPPPVVYQNTATRRSAAIIPGRSRQV
jgi:hypothetical protein